VISSGRGGCAAVSRHERNQQELTIALGDESTQRVGPGRAGTTGDHHDGDADACR